MAWMDAPAVCVAQHIISSHPDIRNVRLVRHGVGRNWRQLFPTPEKQRMHWGSSLADSTDDECKVLHVDPSQFLQKNILELLSERLEKGEVYSLTSRTYVGMGPAMLRHIPMMNFHLEGEITEGELIEIVKTITSYRPGFLLSSGRHYHYYGNFLVNGEEWLKLVGDFLMPCIIVSQRYVGHCLRRGYCSLRLTSEPDYKPQVPKVIECW